MNRYITSICAAAILLIMAAASFAQQTGGVKGTVRTPDGEKLDNVSVTARLDGKDLKSTKTDEKGRFRIDGLKPATYNLVFEKEGYALGIMYNVLIRAKKVNNVKNRAVLTVDQGTLIIIAGSVFDQFGRSVYGAKVEIEAKNKDGGYETVGESYTSQSGEFIFRFRPGITEYKITAKVKDVEASETISVDSPSIYRTAITLTFPTKKS